jgi:hypothetical protein
MRSRALTSAEFLARLAVDEDPDVGEGVWLGIDMDTDLLNPKAQASQRLAAETEHVDPPLLGRTGVQCECHDIGGERLPHGFGKDLLQLPTADVPGGMGRRRRIGV